MNGLLLQGVMYTQFQQIPALLWIRGVLAFFPRYLRNDERELSEWPGFQPAQKSGDSVALVAGQVEPVAELLHGNPPLGRPLLIHVRFEQFGDTRVFFHD
jgi:hypothetical protein